MSLLCRDGVSACSGCGLCRENHESCDSCHKPMAEGEKYYRLSRLTICEDCTEVPKGQLCILCRKPTTDGIVYENIVLCRSCSGVATGYIGYI